MGLPSISIIFKSTGTTAITRGQNGIVALILRDAIGVKGFYKMATVGDIPEGLSASNKEQIQLAFMGTVSPPKEVVCFVVETAAEDYTEAFNYLETVKFNYLVVPPIIEAEKAVVATWVKSQRDNGKKIKVVLPVHAGDHEGIINFANETIKTASKTYTTEQYCGRIAGVLAGLPLTMASTFQVLPELIEIDRKTKAELDTAIDAGKFVLFNDGEKIKVARGVNSLVTTTAEKGAEFKKIAIVDKLDLIFTDVKMTSEDSYIGKVSNKYDHKVLLISAIQGYFEQLENDGLLDPKKSSIGIDFEAQRTYLKSIGVDTDAMNDQEIKEANTKDKVFLKSSIKPLDAMEEINLNIYL